MSDRICSVMQLTHKTGQLQGWGLLRVFWNHERFASLIHSITQLIIVLFICHYATERASAFWIPPKDTFRSEHADSDILDLGFDQNNKHDISIYRDRTRLFDRSQHYLGLHVEATITEKDKAIYAENIIEHDKATPRSYRLQARERVNSGGYRTDGHVDYSFGSGGQTNTACTQGGNKKYIGIGRGANFMKYGDWWFEKKTTQSKNVYKIIFCANEFAMRHPIEGLDPGDHVESQLKIIFRRYGKLGDTPATWYDRATYWLTVRAYIHDDLRISMTTNSEEVSSSEVQSSRHNSHFVSGLRTPLTAYSRSFYTIIEGEANRDVEPPGIDLYASATEIKTNSDGTSNTITGNTPEDKEVVNKQHWDGMEHPIGENFGYGSWYLSNDKKKFVFVPNSEAINTMNRGERVFSKLRIDWDNKYAGTRADDATYEVIIGQPPLVLSVVGDSAPVYEASDQAKIRVRVNANPHSAPDGVINVKYNLINSGTGDFLDETGGDSGTERNGDFNFTRDEGKYTYTTEIPIPLRERNFEDEENGTVMLQLVDGTDYTVNANENTGSVSVIDADTPWLSIFGGEAVRPSIPANFVIESVYKPKGPLTIRYSPVNSVGDFVDGSVEPAGNVRTVTVRFRQNGNTGNYLAHLDVPTVDTNESRGEVSVVLLDDSADPPTYRLSRNFTASVAINDAAIPQLWVNDIETPVTEGQVARFKVSANIDPGGNLDVIHETTDIKGDYLAATGVRPVQQLTFSETGGEFIAYLEVPTRQANGTDEDHGVIAASLVVSSGYHVVPGRISARSIVYDKEIPVFTISPDKPTISTGDLVEVKLTSDIQPWQSLSVYFTPENITGEFLDVSDGPSGEMRISAELTISEFGNTGQYSTIFRFPTKFHSELSGVIQVSLNDDTVAPANYTVGTGTARFNVFRPVTQLSISNVTESIREDESAIFKISASSNPNRDLSVSFTPANEQGADFLDESDGNSGEERTVLLTFVQDENTAEFVSTVEVDIVDDRTQESSGRITVTLNNGTGYQVNSNQNTAFVTVLDNDLPTLSVFKRRNSGHGIPAEVNVESDQSTPPIMVRFSIANVSGEFLGLPEGIIERSLDFSQVDNSGQYVDKFLIPTLELQAETAGSISVTLLPDLLDPPKYSLTSVVDDQSITVEISDAFVPELSILNVSEPVNEGDVVRFKVIASVDTRKSLTVSYVASNTVGSFLGTSSHTSGELQTSELTFSQESETNIFTAFIEVPTNQPNNLFEGNGEISVELREGSGYALNPSLTLGSVAIVDVDSPIELSIHSVSEPVYEGSVARFTVTASKDPEKSLTVSYVVSNISGSYIDTSTYQSGALQSIEFSFKQESNSNLYAAIIEVPTNQPNNLIEGNGKISVELKEKEGYELNSSLKLGFATIVDLDSPIELSIHGVSEPIKEGGLARFTVIASRDPEKSLTVPYVVSNKSGTFLDTSNYQSGELQSNEFTFRQETDSHLYTAFIEVPTNRPDNLIEGNGEISVELKEGQGYELNSSMKLGFATIVDVDTPIELSIHGVSEPVKEGGLARFTVIATLLFEESLTVSYVVSNESGAFLDNSNYRSGELQSNEIAFRQDTDSELFTAFIDVPTNRPDNVDEENGEISVELKAGERYTINPTLRLGFATIVDVDIPMLSISNAEKMHDQGVAVFSVESNITPKGNLQVKYVPTNVDGNFLNEFEGISGALRTQKLGFNLKQDTNKFTSSISVPIQLDNSSATGIVKVALIQDTSNSYRISEDTNQNSGNLSANSAIVEIEITPVVSIRALQSTIVEGEQIVFIITHIPAPSTEISIELLTVISDHYFFMRMPKKVFFKPGNTTQLLVVQTFVNSEEQNDKTMKVSLQPPKGTIVDAGNPGDANSTSAAVVTITKKVDSNLTSNHKVSVAASVIRSILGEIPHSSPPQTPQFLEESKVSIAISPVSEVVDEGSKVGFTIQSSRITKSDIFIDISLSDSGDFIMGKTSASVQLREGQDNTTLNIETQDDRIAELDGRITATVNKSKYYEISHMSQAVVIVSDALDRNDRNDQISNGIQTAYSNLLSTFNSQTVAATTERLTHGFNNEIQTNIRFGNLDSMKSAIETVGRTLNSDSSDWVSILDDAAFEFGLASESGSGNGTTVWGVSSHQNVLDGQSSNSELLKGEVSSGQFGIDTRVGQNLQVGLSGSVTDADMEFNDTQTDKLSFDIRNTGIHPYLGFSSLNANTQMQVGIGYGIGQVNMNQDEYSEKTMNSSFFTRTFSGSHLFYDNGSIFGGNTELKLSGEAWESSLLVTSNSEFVDDIRTNVRHLHLAANGTQTINLKEGESIASEITVGVRGDSLYKLSRIGAELGSTVEYMNSSGISLSGMAHSLFTGIENLSDWGLEGMLGYDSGNDRIGLQLDISSVWGQSVDHMKDEMLGGAVYERGISNFPNVYNGRITSELRYGISIPEGNGIFTPMSGATISTEGVDRIHFGSKLTVKTNYGLQLEGVSKIVSKVEENDNGIELGGKLTW